MTENKCYQCGGGVEKTTQVTSRTIGSTTFEAPVPCLLCTSCGTLTYSFEDLAEFDLGVAQQLRDANDTSEEAAAFLRKVQRATQ